MTCCTSGFIEVIGRGNVVVGWTACPRCRPGDAALVAACEAAAEKRPEIKYDHGKWTEVA